MRIIRRLALLAGLALVGGCTTTTTLKLYSGPEKPPSQVALLYLDPFVVVPVVDNITEHPTDKSRVLAHSAGKRREIIALDPGPHTIKTHFWVLCVRSEGETEMKFVVEAGKKYRLKANADSEQRRWRPEVVEHDGSEIESTFAWTTAMCPANVKVVPLRY